jgi:class 3 adenylate cyclase
MSLGLGTGGAAVAGALAAPGAPLNGASKLTSNARLRGGGIVVVPEAGSALAVMSIWAACAQSACPSLIAAEPAGRSNIMNGRRSLAHVPGA